MNRSVWKIRFLRLAIRIQKLFRKNAVFMVLFFLFNYTTLAWSLVNADKIEVMVGYGFSLFLGVTFVTALLQIFRNPLLKNIMKIVLVVVSGIPFMIEFVAMYNYKALIGAGIVNSLLETNSREALEFCNMYFGVAEIIGLLFLIGLFVAIKKYNLISHLRFSRRVQRKIIFGILGVSLLYTVRMFVVYTDFFYSEPLLPMQRGYASAEVAYKNMEAYHTLTSKLNTDIAITENKSKIRNIVFILGESTNRNHMHLYGYNVPNTPNLDALKAKNELSIFTDCVSPHSTTIAVLSKLFTFCDYESDKDWYEYNNLIDVMNAAGYKTFWLSNQESSGIWGNVAQIYAEHSTKHEFTRIRDSREDYGIVDGELFPLVDRAVQEKADKNFYVIHLMGGHGLYYNRFPYSFSKFTKADIKLNIPDEKKDVIAQYDNALYYNDYIVSGIIDKFRDDETIVIYVPDHSEAIYDETGGFTGHIEENPTRQMIEIPVIMWASDKFKANYPDKWAQIQAAVNRPYMTDDMIHTVLEIADIKTPEFDPTKSIIDTKFDATRKRIFGGKDYDAEIKTGKVQEE